MASRSRAGSICEQPGVFQLDRNSLYGEFFSGKGIRNNREFVIPVFVICVNAYNRKDMGKSLRKKLFRYIRQLVVSVFVISVLHCSFSYPKHQLIHTYDSCVHSVILVDPSQGKVTRYVVVCGWV